MNYNVSNSMDLEFDYNNDFKNYNDLDLLSLENFDDLENISEFAVNYKCVEINPIIKNENETETENENEWELINGKSELQSNFSDLEYVNCEANYLNELSFDLKNFDTQPFFNSLNTEQSEKLKKKCQPDEQLDLNKQNSNENENENGNNSSLFQTSFVENLVNIDESEISENDSQFYNQQTSQGEDGQIENVDKDELFKNSPLGTSCYNNLSTNKKETKEENDFDLTMSEEIGSEKQQQYSKSINKKKKNKKKSKPTEGWNRKTFKVLYGDKQRVTILKIKRTRNKRKNTTEDAKEIWESWFNNHYNEKQGPYPNKYTRNILAKKTNTPELQVQRWFGQRRRIEKERWENGEIAKPNWI
ncbi:hypothetical protein M0812_10657 [Anaeramoeba flamelloides]|uniref:Homeobox domain-containing protein n=1 Tax=Anaeramoeba flamelloides TaxID=1746091 RepID=A0AAV7ZS25_9EUKA|nr:hypothetical protein M0812_10657 [Anaeramoeba flamelloides]